MYSNLTIRRFRCFNELKVEGLKQVNLVTGMNNTGKTTMLEALFLLIGGFNPGLPIRVNALRGLDTLIPNSEEQWGWLFHGHDTARDIEITAGMPPAGEDALRVHLGTAGEFDLLSKGERELPGATTGTNVTAPSSATLPSSSLGVELSDLILEFREHRGHSTVSRVSMGSDGRLKLEQPKSNGFRPGAFLATHVRPQAEDADRLSRLKRMKRDAQVIEALKPLEPDLHELTILVAGGQSVIHAEIGSVGLIPVPMLGEGLGRLLSMTLAIMLTHGGLVLVDEIENGIHHSVLRKVWDGLAVAAKQAQVQLVATTHSDECLQAAHEAFAKRPDYDLGVVQLARLPDGIQARVLDKTSIEVGVEGNIDLR